MVEQSKAVTTYTVSEVSRMLKISPATTRKLAREGFGGAIRVGRQWRIPHEGIAECLKASRGLSKAK